MNANELADWFDGRILYLWDAEDGQYYDSAIADEIVPKLRQQQALIEQLEKTQDYLYKTHDKDKAEIQALKAGKIRAYDNGVEDGRKPNTNLVKEAKYGITTKWDGITTYHETTESIGKAQE